MLKSSMMKSIFRRIPAEITLIAVLLLIFVVVYLLIPRQDSKSEKEIIHYLSSWEYGVYGSSELKQYFKSMNIKTGEYRGGFDASIPEDAAVLFILNPEMNLSIAERDVIYEWVESGGLLVYGNRIDYLIDHSIMTDSFIYDPGYTDDIFTPRMIRDYYESPDDNTKDEHYDVTTNGENGILFSIQKPAAFDPLVKNIESFYAPMFFYEDSNVSLIYELQHDEVIDDKKPDWQTLASFMGSPSIVVQKREKGEIVAIANPLILSNGFISSADNAILAQNIMNAVPKGKAVYFDELHHGFGIVSTESVIDTGWGRAVLIILFVSILAIFSKAVRFIPPRTYMPPQRRSQTEYLYSMAQIFKRARASGTAAEIIIRDFKAKAAGDVKLQSLLERLEIESEKQPPSETQIFSLITDILNHEKKENV